MREVGDIRRSMRLFKSLFMSFTSENENLFTEIQIGHRSIVSRRVFLMLFSCSVHNWPVLIHLLSNMEARKQQLQVHLSGGIHVSPGSTRAGCFDSVVHRPFRTSL